VGDAAYVVEWSNRGKPKPPVEVLRRELCGKRYFARSGIVRGVEEKPHYQTTSTLAPRFRDRGNPRHQCLATLDEREGQAAGRDGPSLVASSAGWWKNRQGDQAARVVGVADTQIGDPLLLGKDLPPDLKRSESFVGTDRGYHLDPR
jgi:hypothetical protein